MIDNKKKLKEMMKKEIIFFFEVLNTDKRGKGLKEIYSLSSSFKYSILFPQNWDRMKN